MIIREINIEDYDDLLDLFSQTPGITVRDADSKESTKKYLLRNPNLNFVATVNSEIIGCVMCGHDGRRGYLQHLIVKPKHQKKGIGQKLFEKCITNLKSIAIHKTHIFVFKDNNQANSFWMKQGWEIRDEINMYSYNETNNKNV